MRMMIIPITVCMLACKAEKPADQPDVTPGTVIPAAGQGEQTHGTTVPTPRPSEPAKPIEPQDTASMSVAVFRGNNLTECVEARVITRMSDNGEPFFAAHHVTAHHIVLILAEDILVMGTGGRSTLAAGKPSVFTEFFTKGIMPNSETSKDGRVGSKPVVMDEKVLAGIKWPPESLAKLVEKGEMASVASCASMNRIALGTCTLKQSALTLEWTVTRQHFDVRSTSDTDAGLRHCLLIGGEWSQPAADDPAAARERLRQRAATLNTPPSQ